MISISILFLFFQALTPPNAQPVWALVILRLRLRLLILQPPTSHRLPSPPPPSPPPSPLLLFLFSSSFSSSLCVLTQQFQVSPSWLGRSRSWEAVIKLAGLSVTQRGIVSKADFEHAVFVTWRVIRKLSFCFARRGTVGWGGGLVTQWRRVKRCLKVGNIALCGNAFFIGWTYVNLFSSIAF